MAQIQPRPNLLGVRGWVYGGKYQLERYLYILHRVTGLGLLLFILFHFTATTVFRVQGEVRAFPFPYYSQTFETLPMLIDEF